jgi:uncharacterized protein YutE (UPF0331/DUF86 family)
MVNRGRVAAKLADLSDRVSRVKKHCPTYAAELLSNRDALDLVSFNLMLAVQASADIASHLIADEGWPAAQSLAEGLRNVVAHGYSGVDANLVHAAATQGVAELDLFAREVVGWLTTRTAP